MHARLSRLARRIVPALAVLVLAAGLAGCMGAGAPEVEPAPDGGAPAQAAVDIQEADGAQRFVPAGGTDLTLKIASGSENKEAAEAIAYAAGEAGVTVEMHYMGSLEIRSVLEAGGADYDAVWPASSMWISLGDTGHITRNAQSTSTTPVVFGIARGRAEELGWVDASGATASPTTAEILDAVEAGELSFAMTSATQSNSGASAYLAFLTALSGSDGPLTADDLADAELTGRVAALLSGVDRSSGSSDWLKEMVVADPGAHQAMVNYESLVSQADRELEEAGAEPLMAIYPADGIAVSDSPLAYVDRGQDAAVEDAFLAFQQALADDEATLAMERVGRRCGLGGKILHADDPEVQAAFSPDWGIVDDASVLKSIPLPAGEVIGEALTLYQTALKKPSYSIWVVDYSGSMYGEGKDGVVAGLEQALDPALAAASLIQPTEGDVNVLIPFADGPGEAVVAEGADTAPVLDAARSREPMGGTDIYAALEAALELAEQAEAEGRWTVAIALMSDGQSETENRARFEGAYDASGTDVPVFSIMFGSADPAQLDDLSALTNGRTFDGRTGDLAAVFRQVKGYN